LVVPGRFAAGMSASRRTATGSNRLVGIWLPAKAVRTPLVPVEVNGSKMLRPTPLKSPLRIASVGTVRTSESGCASLHFS
jgi:hypothetical protein